MATAPINYGSEVGPDNQGTNALSGQVGRSAEINSGLADDASSKITPIIQGVVHNQALKATATVKVAQAKTLSFIDSNPYVDKAVLQQRMSPEDYQSWHTKMVGQYPQYKDADTVPMYTAAGDLFDSETKQTREQAGSFISLPGWQGSWKSTEEAESATVRDRYVNRMAADQMIADQRAQTLSSTDAIADNAQSKADFQLAAKGIETSRWFHPAAQQFQMKKYLVQGDSFQAEQAMLQGDVKGMKEALDTLRGPNAKDLYPNMNEQQRLSLEQRVARMSGMKGTKVSADALVGPYVDERGKVDSVGIAKAVQAYQGPDKDQVEQAARAQEANLLHIWDAQTSSVQAQIRTAGQDPKTGVFSMARAQQNPAIAKLANQLNQDDPTKLGALAAIDTRRQAVEDKKDRQAQALELKAQISTSHENLKQIRNLLDDETQSDHLHAMTPEQWDAQLSNVEGGLTEGKGGDYEQARKDFAAFQKRGGKPDERAGVIVADELKQAARGDKDKLTNLTEKYKDKLEQVAHSYLRANTTLTPAALTDGLRTEIKKQLVRGSVVGGSEGNAKGVTRYDWEQNPTGSFKLPDGSVVAKSVEVSPDGQWVKLTNARTGEVRQFQAGDLETAKSKGWK